MMPLSLFLECVGPLGLVCKSGFVVVWLAATLVFVSFVVTLAACVVMSSLAKSPFISFSLYWYVVFYFFLIKYISRHVFKKNRDVIITC
jgi:hypothetical protein